MAQRPRIGANAGWGIGLIGAGVTLLALAARFLSADGNLTSTGLEMLRVARLTLAVTGALLVLFGVGLIRLPPAVRRGWLDRLDRSGHVVVPAALATFLALFAFNSVVRTARLSPDSMNYIDVARHLARGDGLVQSTLGFNQNAIDPAGTIPTPFTAQPPLYPILIAATGRLGLDEVAAALLLPALAYGLVLALVGLLAAKLHDRTTGWIVLALAAAWHPLGWVAGWAWSETIALAFMLGAILLLVRGINGSPNGAPRLLIAGMLAGLAVDTRFSMIFLAPLALVAVVAREAGWRRRIGDLFAFGAGMALTLGPLLLHYARAHGGAVPPRIASIHPPIAGELTDAFVSVFGRWAGIHPMIELPALVVGLVAITLVLHRRRGIATDTAGSRARRVPWIGAGLYFACLIAMKWIAYAEPIGARLALPGALLLLVPAGWLVAEAWRPTRAAAMALAVAVLVLRIGAEVVLLVTGATFRPADPVAASARLGWVAAETTARDLVIGDDTMDIPFWLGRPAAVSFSPWPQTSHPELATLRALCRRQSAGHDRFFIVVREHGADEVAWRQAYGPFIADLVHDRLGVDDGITRVARLADAHVFELRP